MNSFSTCPAVSKAAMACVLQVPVICERAIRTRLTLCRGFTKRTWQSRKKQIRSTGWQEEERLPAPLGLHINEGCGHMACSARHFSSMQTQRRAKQLVVVVVGGGGQRNNLKCYTSQCFIVISKYQSVLIHSLQPLSQSQTWNIWEKEMQK